MPPAVIDAITSFRASIDSQERTQSLRMARAWLEVSRGLDSEFERLATDVANAANAGRGVSLWHISRMNRYQSLMGQILQQQRQFAPVAADEITQTQALLGRWAITQSSQLITIQNPAVAGQFDRLPVSAVTNMVGSAGDGTPLGDLLRSSFGAEGVNVGNALVRGTALGWNPAKTARAMRDEVNVTLEQAMLIARSEQMRVYREASRQQWINSNVVESYQRIASKSMRTCMACLMADGRIYPLTVSFEEHPNGRCTAIPVVRGAPPVVYETGEQWFMRQDEATQRRMMGPGRFDAWQEGRFALADLVTVRQNRTWGNSLQVTPLRVLAARPAGSVARTTVPPSQPPQPPLPPPSSAPQPHGTPVSNALTLPLRSPSTPLFRDTMAAIDSVHGDGLLDTIPLELVSGTSYEAAYQSLTTGKAYNIQVRRDSRSRAFSLVHEIGHWLDHQQIGVSLRTQNDALVQAANVQILAAIRQSQAHQFWRDLLRGRASLTVPGPNGTTRQYTPTPSFMRYVLSDEEMWARAYAQYILVRSQQADLVLEFNDYRSRPEGFDHWDDTDFSPIATAIDLLMERLGWRQ